MMGNSEIRKQLHRQPELSGEEGKTAAFIWSQLEEIGLKEIYSSFSQHSLLAVIDGESHGKTIMFRAELDALPIQEKNEFSYRSAKDGVSHKCGHDGHMTILLSLAEKLVKHPPKKGRFLLLFQSAEESGEGARSIIESGFLHDFKIDFAIALHNVPGYPLGSVVCKPGPFTPSVESFSVKLKGETSHAGQPDKGANPALCIAEIINYMNGLHQPDSNSADYFVVAPIHIHMGGRAYGTSAGSGELGYTIRANDYVRFNVIKESIVNKINELSSNYSLSSSISWIEPFAANKNNPDVVDCIKAASDHLNIDYIDKKQPFDWGEDFGLFTQNYTGAMFGLGSGEDAPPLHDESYDFPDELIEIGSNIFYELANQFNK